MSFMRRIWPVYRPAHLHCQVSEYFVIVLAALDFLAVNAAVLNWQQQDNVCGAVVMRE